MTIGVLTTSFPRFAGDFAGCFVEDAVRNLAASGAAVEVIAAGDANTDDTADLEWRPDLGASVAVRRIKVSRGQGATPLFYGPGAPEALEQGGIAIWGQAVAFWAGLCRALRARASSWKRVEAHWLVPCALAAGAVVPGLPLVAHAHSGDVALLERLPGGASLARRLAGECPHVQFASRDLRGRFARLAGIPIDRAGMVASSDRSVRGPTALARSEARRALNLQGRTLLSVGRLVPIKGFDVLVRAAAVALAQHRAGATVVILGDGPERARLRDLAHRLNVDLRLPGFVPRADVARWMAGADLYVQPSRRLSSGRTEGLPVSTLEALAAGLSVVASATGGLAELPQPAPRLRLVPPNDHSALAACLVA